MAGAKNRWHESMIFLSEILYQHRVFFCNGPPKK